MNRFKSKNISIYFHRAGRLLVLVAAFSFCCVGFGSVELSEYTAKELRVAYANSNDIAYVRELILRMQSNDDAVSLDSLHSLGLLGDRFKDSIGAEVVASMLPLLECDDESKLYVVVTTLQAYGRFAAPALGRLIKIVDEGEPGASFIAARIIGMIGVAGNEAQDTLVRALGSYEILQIEAANSLGRIGELSEDNAGRMEALLESSNLGFKTRLGIASALAVNRIDKFSIGINVSSVFELGVSSSDGDTRYLTLKRISDLSLARNPWFFALVEKVQRNDEDEYIRLYASKLLLGEFEGEL